MSVLIPIHFPPSVSIFSLMVISLEFLLAAITTVAPFNEIFIAKDWPIPDEAPVMTHTFPVRSKKINLIFYLQYYY